MGLILCRKLIDFSWTKKNTLITVILTVLKEVKYSRRDKMNVIFCRPELTMEDVEMQFVSLMSVLQFLKSTYIICES